MLVLSRRCDEGITFANLGITIRVLHLTKKQVRIGIEAPPEVHVLRQELERHPSGANTAHSPADLARLAASRALGPVVPGQHPVGSSSVSVDAFERMFHVLKGLDDEAAGQSPGAELPRRPSAMKRALVVDDNANESRLLASYLRLKEVDVVTAEDGAAAMHYLARHAPPDVVLLDMNMPHFDGRWTVHQIRGNDRYDSIALIAVSGIHPAEYGVPVGPRGCDQWFQKPLNPQRLVDAILQQPATPILLN
ncbi:MAG: response regulator [Planctomycetales bacterium]|nr:response regulator [Planctomycetales bacterium]